MGETLLHRIMTGLPEKARPKRELRALRLSQETEALPKNIPELKVSHPGNNALKCSGRKNTLPPREYSKVLPAKIHSSEKSKKHPCKKSSSPTE